MLREFLSSVGPFLGLCHSHPSLAELGLFALISFIVGFCCGGLTIGFIVSSRFRQLLGKFVVCLLEEGRTEPWTRQRDRGSPRASSLRLDKYRSG